MPRADQSSDLAGRQPLLGGILPNSPLHSDEVSESSQRRDWLTLAAVRYQRSLFDLQSIFWVSFLPYIDPDLWGWREIRAKHAPKQWKSSVTKRQAKHSSRNGLLDSALGAPRRNVDPVHRLHEGCYLQPRPGTRHATDEAEAKH